MPDTFILGVDYKYNVLSTFPSLILSGAPTSSDLHIKFNEEKIGDFVVFFFLAGNRFLLVNSLNPKK